MAEKIRASDQVLAADLREAGQEALAARAEASEWNDYFGPHTMPQHHLIQTLKDTPVMANVVRKRLIQNTIDGKYDGTKEESDEWAASADGQQAFRSLISDVLR